MKITCIADLHGEYPELPGGDLLLLAGDYTGSDKIPQWADFFIWLNKQDYRKKVMIGGNHDNFLTQCCNNKESADIFYGAEFEKKVYLRDSGTEFEGLKIWGTPYSRTFEGINPNCAAFSYADETWFYDEKIKKIPRDTDILLTHAPAAGGLDMAKGKHLGSRAIHDYLKYVARPRLHVFGHIHESYGQEERYPGCISINCSHMNGDYDAVNKPITIEL